jgi:transposase-like protein
VGRRGIKEYRAAEALGLIAADRDHRPLVCPYCSTPSIERNPKRNEEPAGRVTLTCKSCGRVASYLVRASMSTPEEPRRR